tara:strand:- start:328 stop:507 length:180 start_codon:yes stop_codon:yes gene_type:complete
MVRPMYSKEIYKQLQDLKEIFALQTLLNEERINGFLSIKDRDKITERLRQICFPEEIEL